MAKLQREVKHVVGVITAMNEEQKRSKDTLVDGLAALITEEVRAATGRGAANLHVNRSSVTHNPRLRQKLSPLYPRCLRSVPNLYGHSFGFFGIILENVLSDSRGPYIKLVTLECTQAEYQAVLWRDLLN
jgi:hypothetical protein